MFGDMFRSFPCLDILQGTVQHLLAGIPEHGTECIVDIPEFSIHVNQRKTVHGSSQDRPVPDLPFHEILLVPGKIPVLLPEFFILGSELLVGSLEFRFRLVLLEAGLVDIPADFACHSPDNNDGKEDEQGDVPGPG